MSLLTEERVNINELTPSQIVKELDKYIVGQKDAKKAVAIAIRNRVRRQKLDDPFLQEEVYPRNIIMIGPTGCGKTEIARRLARLSGAPFVKVEATKFTEVGYVGRDVESMIRDLVSVSINLVKKEFRKEVEEQARKNAEERILDLLFPGQTHQEKKPDPSMSPFGQAVQAGFDENRNSQDPDSERRSQAREMMRKRLEAGELDDKEVEIETQASASPMVQVLSGPNMEDIDMQLQNMLGDFLPKKSKRRKVKVEDARTILFHEEQERLIDPDKVNKEAIRRTEQLGIVFVDEIDKVSARGSGSGSGPDVSREGVQRDLLPIVEGATINTRNGPVKTDHILFIAAGAFHSSRPSDLIPELQGRFPIRVELEKLTQEDFKSILSGPENSLTRQSQALLGTEGVTLEFTPDGLDAIAEIAFRVNEQTENIGARRLHTIMERLLEDISFSAPDLADNEKQIRLDRDYVQNRLKDIVENRDLSQYIL